MRHKMFLLQVGQNFVPRDTKCSEFRPLSSVGEKGAESSGKDFHQLSSLGCPPEIVGKNLHIVLFQLGPWASGHPSTKPVRRRNYVIHVIRGCT
jgi:hypothetical protein